MGVPLFFDIILIYRSLQISESCPSLLRETVHDVCCPRSFGSCVRVSPECHCFLILLYHAILIISPAHLFFRDIPASYPHDDDPPPFCVLSRPMFSCPGIFPCCVLYQPVCFCSLTALYPPKLCKRFAKEQHL